MRSDLSIHVRRRKEPSNPSLEEIKGINSIYKPFVWREKDRTRRLEEALLPRWMSRRESNICETCDLNK